MKILVGRQFSACNKQSKHRVQSRPRPPAHSRFDASLTVFASLAVCCRQSGYVLRLSHVVGNGLASVKERTRQMVNPNIPDCSLLKTSSSIKFFFILILLIGITLLLSCVATSSKLTKIFYNNGGIKSESPMILGKIHGVLRTYYKSGGIKSEHSFNNGIPDGLWTDFYEFNTHPSAMGWV
jgi:hypothetical protein